MSDQTIHEEIEVLGCDEGNGDEDITISVSAMIEKLQAALLHVPEQFRDKAIFRIRATGDYAHAYLSIEFDRPETDGERRAREQQSLRIEREYEARERATWARLKAKYGG